MATDKKREICIIPRDIRWYKDNPLVCGNCRCMKKASEELRYNSCNATPGAHFYIEDLEKCDNQCPATTVEVYDWEVA